MPKVPLGVAMYCDHPSHNGRRVAAESCFIELRGKRVEVLLCLEHVKPLTELAKLNRSVPVRKSARASRRVPMREQLHSLLDADEKD